MATRIGSAAEFVLATFEGRPTRQWRIAELVATAGGCWKAENFTETLKRLHGAGRVQKTVGEGRSAWWSAVAPILTAAPVIREMTVQPDAPTPDGPRDTAAQFILDLLAQLPDHEWRVAEIAEASGHRWTDANIYTTLTRLAASGTVKKAVTDRQAWWSIGGEPVAVPEVAAPAEPVAAAPVAKPAPVAKLAPVRAVARSPIAAPDDSTVTAAEFITDLLARHPDYEMSVNDIWEEADRRWAAQTVFNTLERLVVAGKVVRVKDGRHVWYSAAAT